MKDDNIIFDIDPNTLDKEWVNQPKLYGLHAIQLADARKEFEEAKANLEIVEAELDKKIRIAPEKYGLEKLTESAIKTCVVAHSKRKEANGVVIETRHAMDVLAALVAALDHRKRALEKLVDLRLADYFSEPKNKTRNGKSVDDMIEESVSRKGQYKPKKKKRKKDE